MSSRLKAIGRRRRTHGRRRRGRTNGADGPETIAASDRADSIDVGKEAASRGRKVRAPVVCAAKVSVGRGWDVAAPVARA